MYILDLSVGIIFLVLSCFKLRRILLYGMLCLKQKLLCDL